MSDDTKVFLACDKSNTNDSMEVFCSDLQRIFDWASDMQLSVALRKCSVLPIGGPRGVGLDSESFIFNNMTLPIVEKIVDLGVTVTHDLKFGIHCESIVKKLTQWLM